MPIKCLTPHRHLELIERILHHVVRIELIDLLHDCLHIASHRIRKQQEFRPRQSLETCQSELVGLEVIQASYWHAGIRIGVSGRSRSGGARGGGSRGGRRL